MRRHALKLGAALCLPVAAAARPLKLGDQVSVLPSLLHRGADGRLMLRVEAWVFERERNTKRTRLLAHALGLDLDELDDADRQRFTRRAALFGADAKDGRGLALQGLGHSALALPPSDADGRVRAAVPVMPALRAGRWAHWSLTSGARRFNGRALWVGDEGLSVVADIDDTIKQTQVRQRREMLQNTFAREFVAVPGMAPWLQRISKADQGVAFHYVSGSPLQLLPPLEQFLSGSMFPKGSMHLRAFSFSPTALLDGEATLRHKIAEISQLLADHPRRRFLLVGDSGERDPETYGQIAREHASRISGVLIRDVTGEAADAPRYAQAFADVPRERWRLFADPTDLPLRWV